MLDDILEINYFIQFIFCQLFPSDVTLHEEAFSCVYCFGPMVLYFVNGIPRIFANLFRLMCGQTKGVGVVVNNVVD